VSQSDFVNRGQALVTAGQYQEAVKVCRLGLLGRPTTVEGRIVLGQALLALKRYDEVLAEMRVALELDHASVSAQVLKGEALLRKGDHHGAIEVFNRARTAAPTDVRIAQLLTEAERSSGKPPMSASHPSVGFVGNDTGAQTTESTKHYPNHGADEEDTGDDDGVEDTGNEYTRPTSLAAPASRKRSSRQQAVSPDVTPPPAVLAVGDRSGTVEVDPEMDGVELGGEPDDFGEIAAPPSSRPQQPIKSGGPRGAVKLSSKLPAPSRTSRTKEPAEVSSVELADDELIEMSEPHARPGKRPPGPATAVRNAVKMPSGPIDLPPAAMRPTALGHAAAPNQPPLAHTIASQGQVVHMNAGPPPQPLPQPPNPRSQIAAALPTAAAMPMPQPPPSVAANAERPTVALNAAQQHSAAAVDALFGNEQPAWARSTMVAGGAPHQAHSRAVAAAHEPTAKVGGLDPQIAAFAGTASSTSGAAMFVEQGSSPGSRPLKTGMRKGRSRLQVVMWILIGAAVIGGGVFAGFQIRAVRLKKQIAAARDQAVDLAKADTWLGWAGARDRLASIAQASNTLDNRAALARARGVLAYEFGDGLVEAKGAVDRLGGKGGFDGAIAAAYVALAQSESKPAKVAADAALEMAPKDAAALYVSGQAALLAGDYKTAISSLRSAHEREPRPLYAVGLARAIAATNAWEDALGAVDRALGAMPDHPAALIQRAMLLVASGRIAPGIAISTETRVQLAKIVAEGSRPMAEQQRGVSPAQVALANLMLAQVDFALRDLTAARADFAAALALGVDEQRLAEEVGETLYAIGDAETARKAVANTLKFYPTSRRARITSAQLELAQGKAAEALAIFTRTPDAATLPRGQAVRGQAHLATEDLDAAKADFDAALKKLPQLELAIIGRAWIDLRAGDVDEARKRIEPKFNPNTSSVAMTTVYAAILRTGDTVSREKAKTILEKAVAGPPSFDVARAQLELARVYRDLGDPRMARSLYAEASKAGSFEARLETGLLAIEDKDPSGGRDTLDQLLTDAGPNPPATLLLETARARMLVGDHPGATQLLDRLDKAQDVVRWQYDRERGRLALRKGDYAGAAQLFVKALESCGDDAETFLLAADVIAMDGKQANLSGKLKTLGPQRLKGEPEASIVAGKLLLAEEKFAEADAAYQVAKKALDDAKASHRRSAQAHFGIAVVAYNRGDDPIAQTELELATTQDPSLYTAYLFAAELTSARKGPGANAAALALANQAVQFNPDLADGWFMVGTYATKLGNSKVRVDAITRLGALLPNSDKLKELQQMR
jgi:tetratricopeptide (TPR) repeat protein